MFALRFEKIVYGIFNSRIEATQFLITMGSVRINDCIVTPDVFKIQEKDFLTEDGKIFFQRERSSYFY